MIKLEAFEPFIAGHSEMAAEGKYGVLVLTNGTWIAIHPENENQSDENKALFDAAFEVNSDGHSAWPLVELV